MEELSSCEAVSLSLDESCSLVTPASRLVLKLERLIGSLAAGSVQASSVEDRCACFSFHLGLNDSGVFGAQGLVSAGFGFVLVVRPGFVQVVFCVCVFFESDAARGREPQDDSPHPVGGGRLLLGALWLLGRGP